MINNKWLVNNCSMDYKWGYLDNYGKLIVIWCLMSFCELVGYLINKEKQYDNIKLISEKDVYIHESIFIRNLGIYLMFMCFGAVQNLKYFS